MLVIIIGLGICMLLAYGITLTDSDWKNIRLKMSFAWGIPFCCVWGAIVVGIMWASYLTYLNQRAFYDATIEQYATAITMYEDRAVIDIESAAWTDLKYKGYQDNISNLILDLRRSIIRYNKIYVIKTKMDSNILFNWIIIGMDEDMKIIKMKTASQHIE